MNKQTTLKLTGKKVKFLDIPTGGLFFIGDEYWTKISPSAAASLGKTTLERGRFGICNFTIDKDDEFIWEVEFD